MNVTKITILMFYILYSVQFVFFFYLGKKRILKINLLCQSKTKITTNRNENVRITNKHDKKANNSGTIR